MKISKGVLSLIVATLLFTPLLQAQSMHDEIAFTRAQIEADRQAIVAATLGLSEMDGQKFWPLYRQYRAEMDGQGDRAWKLLVEFAEKYESLSDADADPLLNEWISIKKKEVAIRGKWMKKFSKTIGAATTARFVQIENKLNAIINLEATAGVPLATPTK